MRALARFIMGGRLRAMLVAATSAVLAVLAMPYTAPFSYLGGAAIALVALRVGVWEAALVLVGAAAGTAVFSYLVLGQAAPLVVAALFLWVPVWLLAGLLRYTVSLARTVQAAALMNALGVVGVYVIYGDPTAWWRHSLAPLLGPALKQNGAHGNAGQVLSEIARLATGGVAAGFELALLACLLLARWWQAVLYNPGGFQREFHGLRMDRASGWIAVAVVAAAVAGKDTVPGTVAVQIGLVLLVMYGLVGLALVHSVVAIRRANVAWLVGLYAALIFLWPMMTVLVVVLASAGLLDVWLDIRRRVSAR